MPKERRSPSSRCRASPYSRGYKNADKRTRKSPSLSACNEHEFEEARCPICMEHPHNAVLLLCSSHEKGCRTYMCDTSSRHSNCLGQFRKSSTNNNGEQTKLLCPLCRGEIDGWTVVDPAREFMDSKTRNCALDTCDFAGNYSQLREHAWRVHRYVKPTDVDPERKREWRVFEEDMEQRDMFNTQFEFDADDNAAEFMVDVSDLANPVWDSGVDFVNYFSFIESDYETIFTEMELVGDNTNLFLDDWDNIFEVPSSHESESRDSLRSTGNRNMVVGRSRDRENARATRSRTEMELVTDDTNLVLDGWDNFFAVPSSHESEIRESGRSRGTPNMVVGRSRNRENARTTRSRTATYVRQRSNRQPSSQTSSETSSQTSSQYAQIQ